MLSSLSRLDGSAPAEADEEDAEESRSRDEINNRSKVNLQKLLAENYPELLNLWLGALEALSNRHDSVRKFCSSQRALLKQLLLKAAPNDAVKGWATDPKHVNAGKGGAPTWHGRFAYLCDRATLGKKYTHFVMTDAKAALTVWKHLNEGEHRVPSRFTSRQLTDLQIRSNCLILMALMISIEPIH